MRGQLVLDTTPNAFTFGESTGAAVGSTVASPEIVVGGLDPEASAAITVTGGEYQLDGGAWVSTAGTVVNGTRVRVRRAASGSYDTPVDVTATIGGVSGTFTIHTEAAPPVSSALLMRPTYSRYVDLGSALNGIHATNEITLTVNGPVAARVHPDIVLTQGQSMTFVHRELLFGNLSAETAGAATGATTWTLTGKAGANETGGTVTVTVDFDVTNVALLSYTIGQRTLAGFGGFPLHEHLPGPASAYSIVGQSAANAFQIMDADNATPSLALQRFLTWNGTYGSTTRTVGTPTVGAAAYWVDLSDGSTTYRVVFDVNVDELNCAPNAQKAAAGQSNQVLQTIGHSTLVRHYGDRCVCEAGDYTNSGGGNSTIYFRGASVRAGGPPKPTTPFLNGYKPEDARHPGWITVQPRRPGTVNFPATVTMRFDAAPSYAAYHRFLGLKFSGASGLLTGNEAGGAGKACHWFAVDHCTGKVNLGPKMSSTNLFAWDCYTKNLQGSVTVLGQDSQIVGCVGDGIAQDFINFGICNSTIGNGRSWIAWNFTKNKKKNTDTEHPDHLQALMLPGDGNFVDAQPAGSTLEMPVILGNVFALGEPSRNASGQGREGGHLIFTNDIRGDLLYHYQIAANVLWDASPQGLWTSNMDPGSKIRLNTLAMYWGVAPGAPGQTGTPYGRANAIMGQTGVEVEWKDTVVGTAAGTPGYTTYVSIGRDETSPGSGVYFPITVTCTEVNLVAVGDATAQAAAYVDPSNYSALLRPQDVLDRLAPKPGGPLTVAGGAPRLVGAIGHPKSLVDFRRRTVDEAAIFA